MALTNKTVQTAHMHSDVVPWISTGVDGIDQRILHARPADNFLAIQLRARPNVVSKLHRHEGPVQAFTTTGTWGHDELYTYRAGTYVYEPEHVLHRFFSGPDPVEAYFVSHGDIVFCDPDTGDEVVRYSSGAALQHYLETCEAASIPRPDLLD